MFETKKANSFILLRELDGLLLEQIVIQSHGVFGEVVKVILHAERRIHSEIRPDVQTVAARRTVAAVAIRHSVRIERADRIVR